MLPSLTADLEELATLGAAAAGIDRRLFDASESAARRRFARHARELGCDVTQDAAGNLFARRPGDADLAPIVLGSHLDTVPGGGPLDGAYGVVAALHVLAALDERGARTAHPVEAVAWAGEEGSRFPLGCLGSAVFAGLTPLGDVEQLRDADGTTFAAARDGADGLLPDVPLRERSSVPAAYLELHIEQGPVLEHRGARVGIVSAIAGQVRVEVVVDGTQGHAGTVPMTLRHDALSASAELVLAFEEAARRHPGAVLTVGRLVVEPNQTNVIPGRVTLRIDARSVDAPVLDALDARIVALCAAVAERRAVAIAAQTIERRAPVAMDAALRAALATVVRALGDEPFELPSGAGHDAMCVAHVAPAAMIFVPSTGGRSHVADERTATADLEHGLRVLIDAVVDVDALLSAKETP